MRSSQLFLLDINKFKQKANGNLLHFCLISSRKKSPFEFHKRSQQSQIEPTLHKVKIIIDLNINSILSLQIYPNPDYLN